MIRQCSTELLTAALAGSLPPDDEDSLQRHLEECEACAAAMEQMAEGAAWCQEAASMLSGDELDDAVPVQEEWSEVDFTVEHLEPSDEPNVLGRLGGYDVLEVLGRGGMGVVLKAFDRELKRCVAIKVLAPHLANNSLAKKRFAREAQAAAAVVHPHVLAIHHVQPNGRLPFLVMPLVAGESLAERLKTKGTLDLREILRIGMQAAAGLGAAHDQGLVHRDVKPANILLEFGVERTVLTDFGLARAADDVSMTRWGIIAGTPEYMSPEQAKGEPLDGRSDLFSLGCVLYEMATGVSPFRTESVMATMRRLVDESPQAMASLNPELPPWFIAIVEKLLEKEPSRRFGSAKEVSELLEGCLAHLQQPASVRLPAALPKPLLAAPLLKHARERRLWLVALLLAAVAGWAAFQLQPGGGVPNAKPLPGMENHEYHVPLTGRPDNLPQMRLEGPNADTCVQFEPEGMRITLPPGHKGSRMVGLSTGIALKGDFEVTVSFEVLDQPRPEDAGPATACCLWLVRLRGKGDTRIVGLTRRMSNTEPGFRALTAWLDLEGKHNETGKVVDTEAKTGRLRLARRGAEVFYYVSEGLDGDFVLIDQVSVGTMDLDQVQLVTFTHAPPSYFDGRFRDLHIRTGSLPPILDTPNKGTVRMWLTAGVVLLAMLVVLFVLVLVLWRRRSRAGAHDRIQAAGPLTFACECGKSLKAKADLAGKRVKCPGCGNLVRVPHTQESIRKR